MSIALALALYLVIWWITLFTVLPFHARSQAETGDVVPGTPAGAPASVKIGRIVIINTLVASVVYGGVLLALYYDVLGLQAMVSTPPGR